MKLEGIHHITAITADAPGNVDFYARVLGLRLVKKTVNQDDPTVYHLFYADEQGSPGSDLTFFEYPGAMRGRAGAGMVHRIVWRVSGPEALDFWARRLEGEGVDVAREDGSLTFADPEGLAHELRVADTTDDPLIADHPEIPGELALQGFDGARAYADDPGASRGLLEEALRFEPRDAGWEARGERRGGWYAYDAPPAQPGVQGAGTVHHIAWASPPEEHEAWRERAVAAGARVTPVIDRFYFRSIYFREPSGVLFEIATIGPGFSTDEPLEHLGERLSLPPRFEPLREQVERELTPIENPRTARLTMVDHGGQARQAEGRARSADDRARRAREHADGAREHAGEAAESVRRKRLEREAALHEGAAEIQDAAAALQRRHAEHERQAGERGD